MEEENKVNESEVKDKLDIQQEDGLNSQLSYSQDILDKRYILYNWLDTKVNLSLAINSALLGFSYILLRNEVGSDLIIKSLIIVAMTIIGVCIYLCLTLTNPAMKSKIWKIKKDKLINKQPRTSVGIKEFEPDEYYDFLMNISQKEMIRYNVDQIVKMNAIVLRSSKKLKSIVTLSAISLIILVLTLILDFLFL
ncbi:MAG: hypothetical protein ACWA5P_13405 [bacterium]